MNIILGVTGSISAYKTVELMRYFQKRGHDMSVVLTNSALKFVSPLSFETFISGRVYYDMFKEGQDPLLHINLNKNNDLLLIAPASADIIGKMANGIADDLLSTVYIAFNKRVVISPAMNSIMLDHPAVVKNIDILKKRGVEIIEPDMGELACEDEGRGRLPSNEIIYDFCIKE